MVMAGRLVARSNGSFAVVFPFSSGRVHDGDCVKFGSASESWVGLAAEFEPLAIVGP